MTAVARERESGVGGKKSSVSKLEEFFQAVLLGGDVGDDEIDDERNGGQPAQQAEREEEAAERFREADEPGVLDRKRNAEAR